MSSAEFSLHQAYWQVEPSGPYGEVTRWAALMAAILNGPLVKRDKTRFRAEEFFPEDVWKPEPEAPPPGAKKKREAPDFSHLRGMKVAKARPRKG